MFKAQLMVWEKDVANTNLISLNTYLNSKNFLSTTGVDKDKLKSLTKLSKLS